MPHKNHHRKSRSHPKTFFSQLKVFGIGLFDLIQRKLQNCINTFCGIFRLLLNFIVRDYSPAIILASWAHVDLTSRESTQTRIW